MVAPLILPQLIGAYQVGMMLLPHVGGPRATSDGRRYIDYTDRDPWDRVRMAAELAAFHSMDPPMREMAAYILDGTASIPLRGSYKLCEWIRWRIRYYKESPGVEILQGPYDTLSTRVADCDDAAILYSCMARAVGIRAHFCGVGRFEDPETMVHAIGYDQDSDTYYELVDDSKYGGIAGAPLVWTIPEGFFTLIWSVESNSYWVDVGKGPIPVAAEDKAMISMNMSGSGGAVAGKAGPGPSGGGGEWYESEAVIEIIRQTGGVLGSALGPETEVTVVGGYPEGYGPPPGAQRPDPGLAQYSEDQGMLGGVSPVLLVGGLALGGYLLWWAFKEE